MAFQCPWQLCWNQKGWSSKASHATVQDRMLQSKYPRAHLFSLSLPSLSLLGCYSFGWSFWESNFEGWFQVKTWRSRLDFRHLLFTSWYSLAVSSLNLLYSWWLRKIIYFQLGPTSRASSSLVNHHLKSNLDFPHTSTSPQHRPILTQLRHQTPSYKSRRHVGSSSHHFPFGLAFFSLGRPCTTPSNNHRFADHFYFMFIFFRCHLLGSMQRS